MKAKSVAVDPSLTQAIRACKGPWLGQERPGLTPRPFAPQAFNVSKMSFGTIFHADGTELFFGFERYQNEEVHDILVTRLQGQGWTEPFVLPFNADVMDGDHCLSRDGHRMVWRSWRLLPRETETRDWSYLWWAERTADGWSEARLLECGGEPRRTGYPAIGDSDALYFPGRIAGHTSENSISILRSRPTPEGYGAPEEIIGGMQVGGDMCVAPDESYLLITCEGMPDNVGSGDLYISFRRSDDTWTPLAHTGPVIHSHGKDAYVHCAAVTPDGESLLYRVYDYELKRSSVFWVSTRILEPLRPSGLR